MHKGEGGLSTVCALVERGGLDRKSKLESTGRICHELKTNPLILDSFPVERLIRCARRLVADADTSTRVGALRMLRYSIIKNDSVRHFINLQLPIFVVRSMEREQKLLSERIQALKVIRRIMEIDAAQLPASLVASVVAIASHKDDNMRRVCLETLREMALANVVIVAEANGIKVIVDAILEPSFQDLADPLLLTVLWILNEPATRVYIQPFIDTQLLLAPFTDTDLPAGNERRQRWAASRNAIVKMMRSWTGIVLLTSNRQGLHSLIQLLVQPVGEDVQKAVLSTICEIFYKRASFEKSATESETMSTTVPISISANDYMPKASQHNLLDHYTVIVLLAMIHCGILDALITLGTGPNRELAEPAIDLLSDILRMSSRLLPDQHCAALLALPQLVSTASLSATGSSLADKAKSLSERSIREKSIRASEMLAELAVAVGTSSYAGPFGLGNNSGNASLVSYGGNGVNGVQLAAELLRDTNRPQNLPYSTRSSSITALSGFSSASKRNRDGLTSREQLVLELKQSIDAQIDDVTFKEMLHTRCRVLTEKNWNKWNWDIISELLEGPLTNPQRLSEAMKTKFFKRLSGFFRCDPGNKGYFSQLAWIPDYVPFLRPACQMYTLLLNHPEGLMFLKTDRRGQLLTEISAALELEARPEAAIVESHIGALKARMFSPEYCSRRMLREYFTLLGLMSSSKEGLKMMEQSNLFQRLYVMGTTKGHDFLCRLILANLDYSVDGSSRKLLQSWMTEGSKPLRLYATCLLRALFRSEVADFARWGIDALITQLTQEEEVAKAALSVLEEASETTECLQAMILKRPVKLMQLRDIRAESLLLKFLSLNEGFSFLEETGNWIPRTLSAWKKEKHISYVHLVENALFRGLNRNVSGRSSTATSGGSGGRKVCNPTPIPVFIRAKRGSKTPNQRTCLWGLDWLYRMPWNMEVKIVGPPGSGPPSNLILETYIDGSLDDDQDLRVEEDDLRMNSIRVKGIVVDARNIPQPVIVNSQQTLQACLFLGTQPVDRRGFTKPPPQSNGGFVLHSSGFSTDPLKDRGARTRSTSSTAMDRLSEPSLTNPLDFQDPSIPAADSVLEENKDWSSCQPEQRSPQYLSSPECSICGPGERAVWNFRVEMDTATNTVKRLLLKSVEFTLQLLPLRPRIVPLPPHLYGELVKTNAGCDVLEASSHIAEFICCLRDASSVPLEKRAALWAIGHIAATSNGYDLILTYAPDFVDVIVKLAANSPSVSIRGTCFFVLGLISRSPNGRLALSKLGWEASHDSSASIAIPNDPSSLFMWPSPHPPAGAKQLVPTASTAVWSVIKSPASPLQLLLERVPPEWKDVLRLVADLSNHITQKEAHASLSKLKASKPELFEDPMLLMYVHALLEKYNFRLALRQFLMNSFDRAELTDEALDSILKCEYNTKTGVHIPHPKELLRRRSSPSIPSFTASIQSVQAAMQASSQGRLSAVASSGRRASLMFPPSSGSDNMNNMRPKNMVANGIERTESSLLPRTRKPSNFSETTIFIGAPEAMV